MRGSAIGGSRSGAPTRSMTSAAASTRLSPRGGNGIPWRQRLELEVGELELEAETCGKDLSARSSHLDTLAPVGREPDSRRRQPGEPRLQDPIDLLGAGSKDEVAFSEPRRRDGLTSGVVTEPTDPLDAVSADRPAGTKEKPWKTVLVELDFAVRFPSVQLLVAELAASFTSANARLDR
jgi:hypothetical protein